MVEKCYNLFLKLGHIGGFIPWIKIHKKALVNKTFSLIYTGLITFLIIFTCIFKIKQSQSSNPHMIHACLVNVFLVFFITKSCANRKYWEKWIQLYEKINVNKMDLGWKPILIFAAYIIYFSLTIIMRYHLFTINTHYASSIKFIKLLAEYTIIVNVMILVKGFRTVNQFFKQLTNENELQKPDLSYNVKLYKCLYEMSTCFNKLFGWILLIYFIYVVMSLCFLTDFLMKLVIERKVDFKWLVFCFMQYLILSVSNLKMLL